MQKAKREMSERREEMKTATKPNRALNLMCLQVTSCKLVLDLQVNVQKLESYWQIRSASFTEASANWPVNLHGKCWQMLAIPAAETIFSFS